MHVPKALIWGLGGLGALVVTAALVKRKEPAMLVRRPTMKYIAQNGDVVGQVGQRFGFKVFPARAGIKMRAGQTLVLPRAAADTGPRPGARGVVKAA